MLTSNGHVSIDTTALNYGQATAPKAPIAWVK